MLVEVSKELLKSYPLCDSCLGRQFAMLIHGTTNEARGRAVKLILAAEGHREVLEGRKKDGVALLRILAVNGMLGEAKDTIENLGLEVRGNGKKCYLCNDTIAGVDKVSASVMEALKDYSFRSFLIGVKVPSGVEEREDEVRSLARAKFGESIKGEFSRRIGKIVGETLGKPVEFKTPDILVVVNPFTAELEVNVNPLYVFGRYLKMKRGIPQTAKPCRSCRGTGCQECGWTGKQLRESVEDFIGQPIMEATKGEQVRLHAAVRDGVDTLVLGNGRPFILEVKRPKERLVDLKALEKEVNVRNVGKIAVKDLRFSTKDEVKKVKRGDKVNEAYRALIEIEADVTLEELDALRKALTVREVRQLTVKGLGEVKNRLVYGVEIQAQSSRLIELRVSCQGGLYMRGFITGEGSRVTPNIREILNKKVECLELDVHVHTEEP